MLEGAAIKRVGDLVLATGLLWVTAPFWGIIALAIRLTSAGPVLYAGRRVGMGGNEFLMYKFRTMHRDADRVGPAVTAAGDPRITSVGRLLRLSKLDELPQLLNVLRGEMSLVGPRPEVPEYVALYDDRQRQVLSVRPGITGPTQILFRHEEQLLQHGDIDRQYRELFPRKLESDLRYAAHHSPVGDAVILMQTVRSLIERFREQPPPEVEALRVTHIITLGTPMAGAQFDTLYTMLCQQPTCRVEAITGNDGPFREACQQAGMPAHVIPFKNTLVDPFGDIRAILALRSHLRRSRPHIVHTHSSKAGTLGRVAARLAGVPIVVHTWHGPSFHVTQPLPVRWSLIVIERFLDRLTDYHTAVADTLGDSLIQHRVCTAGRIRTVISGIPFDTFPADPTASRRRIRHEFGVPESASIVVSVGTLQANKAHDTLIAAAHNVLAERPDTYFLIAGPPVALEAGVPVQLQDQIDRLGLSGKVSLCGMRNDVPDLLAAADVFVQTSWREGLSRSLVEAMYSGLAVVATDAGATREVIRDGETGYLIRPGHPEIVAACLLTLLGDPALRVRLGTQARNLIGDTRTVEAMGNAFDTLYRELVHAKLPTLSLSMDNAAPTEVAI